MRNLNRYRQVVFACAVLWGTAWAVDVSGRIVATESRSLSFGAIAASTAGGIVTVSPEGLQTCSVVQCLGGAHAALFRLASLRDYSVSISISPASLVNANGDRMVVTPIYNIRNIGYSTATSLEALPVGGELRLAPNQAPGAYSGTYELMFDYE